MAIGKWLIFFGFGVFIIWFSLRSIPDDKYDEFISALREARYWMAFPVLFILSGSHLVRAWRWQLLIEPLGKKPGIVNAFFAVMIGYLANLAVPRLGEVLRCTLLSRYEKISTEELLGTVVAERAFDVLCLGVVFLMALFFQYDIVWNFVQQSFLQRQDLQTQRSVPVWIWIVALMLVASALLVIIFRKKVMGSPLATKFFFTIQGLKRGLLTATRLKHRGYFFLSSALIWVLYIAGTWLGFMATSGSDQLGPEVALTALAFGSLGMILTPGGIGSYALFLAQAMRQNGVPFELGYANGTLQWLAQFAVVLLIGSLSLLLMPIYNRSKQK